MVWITPYRYDIIEFPTITNETIAAPIPRSSTPILPALARMTICQPDLSIPSADIANQVDRDQLCSSYSYPRTKQRVHQSKGSLLTLLSSIDELDEVIFSVHHPVLVQEEDSYGLKVRPVSCVFNSPCDFNSLVLLDQGYSTTV